MEILRCPNCGRSFVLVGAEDTTEYLEMTLFCLNCIMTIQIQVPKAVPKDDHPVGFHPDDGTGQYL